WGASARAVALAWQLEGGPWTANALRSIHPCPEFKPRGGGSGAVPALGKRPCPLPGLRKRDLLPPFSDKLAKAGSKTGSVVASRRVTAALARRSTHAGSSNDPVWFSNSTLTLQISMFSSTSRTVLPCGNVAP